MIAEQGGEIVGHAMLSYVTLEEEGRRLLELGPVSVRPDRQRLGAGAALISRLLREADSRGEPLVLVLGHSEYSSRFGFRPASTFGIRPAEPGILDEAFMACPLSSYDPAVRGSVVFPPAYSID